MIQETQEQEPINSNVMDTYRLYARHADGTKSVWDGEFESFADGRSAVVDHLTESTGSRPDVVLALVTPTFKENNDV